MGRKQKPRTDLFDCLDPSPTLASLGYMVPNVHRNDGASSSLAAESMERSGKRQRHAEIVLALVAQFPGCTAVELWDHTSAETRAELVEMQEVRRRLTDLQAAELVVQGDERLCRVRCSKMGTWFLIESTTKERV